MIHVIKFYFFFAINFYFSTVLKNTTMAHHHFDENSSKKFTLTLFLSFVAVFVFVLLMMLWHGDVHPNGTTYVRVVDGPSSGKAFQIEKEPLKKDSAEHAD
jgi:hypothetical protein